MNSRVPEDRIHRLVNAPPNPDGEYVLYWMTMSRRTRYNFALQRAADLAQELTRPLVVVEALGINYPHACARFHRFLLDGMADNRQSLARRAPLYYPYVEPTPGAGKGLVAALAGRATAVVTDHYPHFWIPPLSRAAARDVDVRFEAVDSSGLLPVASTDRYFTRAVDFRRHVQRTWLHTPPTLPAADPLARRRLPRLEALPGDILRRWPMADRQLLDGDADGLAALPVDPAIAPTGAKGGPRAAGKTLDRFLTAGLPRYGERNQPAADVTSGLSPYLHFGHIAPQEIFVGLTEPQGWTPERLGGAARGARSGFWGLSEPAEAFLDQLLVWRELGFNACHTLPDYDRYESLPAWAQKTLAQHAADPRPYVYSAEQLERAETHDPLWNAAQRQLTSEGRLHNYLRMLWGKKILEWSPDPRSALDRMLLLNDRYALDGRDPNSISGIFWTLGRYDRAWGPERAIFGKVRYMSSQNTARKVRVKEYLRRYGAEEDDDENKRQRRLSL